MLYFQVLFYIESLPILSYHCSQLIPDIFRTELVLGTSSQFVILLVYNFSSWILGILFSDRLQSAHILIKILRINCAPSRLYSQEYTEMHGQQIMKFNN